MRLFKNNGKGAQAPKAPKTWYKPAARYYNVSALPFQAEHTLIAGATGCGKSTFLHSIIQAFLVNYAPCEAQIVLLDPKEVELARYKALPHCKAYATDEQDILAELNKAIDEMHARYKQMSFQGIEQWQGAKLYIVIEELSDLMACPLARQIKVAIQRLAQKGRAAGLSLIVCTQAPARKILPAEITLNLTARFALACESAIESRQIIGQPGAELLPDHGQAIYKYRREKIKVALPFVQKQDVLPLIEWWTKQAV